MSRLRDYLVPPAKGPFAGPADGDLGVLDDFLSGVDAMNEADRAGKRAGADVLAAGQAAVDAINARRGRS